MADGSRAAEHASPVAETLVGTETVDVLIVGAGLSGVGAACHLERRCPSKSYAILEARGDLGGTWDLFRYPGIRSDSDMHTLGYAFRPWRGEKAITDGPSIRDYIRDTAAAYGVDRHIRLHHKVLSAAWSSARARWLVTAEAGGAVKRFECGFLYLCPGYYDYEQGHAPDWPGMDRFAGTIIHPQHWPEGLNYAAKRIAVIGSGATAVTLVPELAKRAGHVVMLQRSPTYIVSRPARDAVADALHRIMSAGAAHRLARWKNVLLQWFFYNLAQKRPEKTKQKIKNLVREELGAGYDVQTHFTPRYNPWDQRLCLVPDSDLFKALRAGTAEIVTDAIASFTEDGIALQSGKTLKADIVVTATGLKLKLFGGVDLSVDGAEIRPETLLSYRGCMFSGLPNLANAFGYTNASWTLKCDLTAEFVCRLLNHMDRRGYAVAVPRRTDPSVTEEPLLDFSSGYVQRALDALPRQGSKGPWKLYQNYFRDIAALRHGRLENGVLHFERRPARKAAG